MPPSPPLQSLIPKPPPPPRDCSLPYDCQTANESQGLGIGVESPQPDDGAKLPLTTVHVAVLVCFAVVLAVFGCLFWSQRAAIRKLAARLDSPTREFHARTSWTPGPRPSGQIVTLGGRGRGYLAKSAAGNALPAALPQEVALVSASDGSDEIQAALLEASLRQAETEAAALRERASAQAEQIRAAAAAEAAALHQRAAAERAQLLESRYTAARQTLSLELRAMDEDSAERRESEEAEMRERVQAEAKAEADAILAAATDAAAHVLSEAEQRAGDVVRHAETQAAALQVASNRRREAEEALAVGHFNATRQLLAQELHALDDDAREEATREDERRRRERELAVAQFNSARQLLRDELRILNEEAAEAEARRSAEEAAAAAALLVAQQEAEEAAAATRRQAMEEAAEKLRHAEEAAAARLRQSEEHALAVRRAAEQEASEMSPRVDEARAAAEAAAAAVEEARVAAAAAAEEMTLARAAQAATAAEIQRQLTSQETRLRAEFHRDLQRRTGALAEQHARAMQDVNEAHAEQMREQRWQLRLAEAGGASSPRPAQRVSPRSRSGSVRGQQHEATGELDVLPFATQAAAVFLDVDDGMDDGRTTSHEVSDRELQV